MAKKKSAGSPNNGEKLQRLQAVEENSESETDAGILLPDEALRPGFARLVRELEEVLSLEIWCLIQGPQTKVCSSLNPTIWKHFEKARHRLPSAPIGLLIHSPGGEARSAYQIARLLQKRCGGFVSIVPRYAKSAATLLALGAKQIILGDTAELGPIDAQLFDRDREARKSALDEVQSLERLYATAIQNIDYLMTLLVLGTGKKTDSLLPHALHFTAEMMEPLVRQIDTVNFNQLSRILKVAQEYATRLLMSNYNTKKSELIANTLVEAYPEHEFVIDFWEAEKLGLRVELAGSEIQKKLDKIAEYADMDVFAAIGRIEERPDEREGTDADISSNSQNGIEADGRERDEAGEVEQESSVGSSSDGGS